MKKLIVETYLFVVHPSQLTPVNVVFAATRVTKLPPTPQDNGAHLACSFNICSNIKNSKLKYIEIELFETLIQLGYLCFKIVEWRIVCLFVHSCSKVTTDISVITFHA